MHHRGYSELKGKPLGKRTGGGKWAKDTWIASCENWISSENRLLSGVSLESLVSIWNQLKHESVLQKLMGAHVKNGNGLQTWGKLVRMALFGRVRILKKLNPKSSVLMSILDPHGWQYMSRTWGWREPCIQEIFKSVINFPGRFTPWRYN